MQTLSVEELSFHDYNVKFLNALKQTWKENTTFSCLNDPKKQCLFLCFFGCGATYRDKNGKVTEIKSGDVVYTPTGSEYSVMFTKAENGYTIGVNFQLFDEKNSPFVLSDEVKAFHNVGEKIKTLFEKLFLPSDGVRLRKKILLFEILISLGNETDPPDHPLIGQGIRHLRKHYCENTSVAELAALCSVSEVYFRRLFKLVTKLSPNEYRTKLRLERAKDYLEISDLSVREISDALGYSTVSHFIKQFKAEFSVSPLSYRKQTQIKQTRF